MSSLYPNDDVLAPNNGIPPPSGAPAVARAPLGVGVSQPQRGFQPKVATGATPAPAATGPGVPSAAPPGTPGAPPATGAPLPGATPQTNAAALYRAQLLQGGGSSVPAGIPDYLRNQYNFQGGGSEASSGDMYFGPGSRMLDSQGREVVLLNDDGSLANSQDLDFNEGYTGEKWYDPELGWVTNTSNTNENRWKADAARRQAIAIAIIGSAAGAGALGLGGAGAAGEGLGITAAGEAGVGAGVSAATTADALTPLINDALLQPLATGGAATGGSAALAELPTILTAEQAAAAAGGTAAAGATPALGSTPAGIPQATIPPDIPLNTTPPAAGTPLATPPPITQGPPGAWDPASLLTPGNVARAGLTVAGALGQHGAPAGATGGTGNPAGNPALNEQATQDILSRGKPTADQMSLIKASIEQQRKQATEAIIQASYNAGQGGAGSMLAQDKLTKLNEDLALLEQTMIQKQSSENVRNALSELGTLSQAQLALAQMALNEDKAAQDRAAAIMQSIMYLWANV